MKIRAGFVANSSTSSFVLFGWCVDEEIDDFIKKFDINVIDAEWNEEKDEEYVPDAYEISDLLSKKCGIQINYRESDEDGPMVGFQIDGLTKDKLAEVLSDENIQKLKDIFKATQEPMVLSGSYYN